MAVTLLKVKVLNDEPPSVAQDVVVTVDKTHSTSVLETKLEISVEETRLKLKNIKSQSEKTTLKRALVPGLFALAGGHLQNQSYGRILVWAVDAAEGSEEIKELLERLKTAENEDLPLPEEFRADTTWQILFMRAAVDQFKKKVLDENKAFSEVLDSDQVIIKSGFINNVPDPLLADYLKQVAIAHLNTGDFKTANAAVREAERLGSKVTQLINRLKRALKFSDSASSNTEKPARPILSPQAANADKDANTVVPSSSI